MMFLFLCGGLSFFLVFFFYLLSYVLIWVYDDGQKLSPFECGFSSLGLVCEYFSINFFLVMLMFVVFDLEVVMFLGCVVSGVGSLFSYLFLVMFVIMGFYMEWYYGKLVWVV